MKLEGNVYYIAGAANRKSIASFVAHTILNAGGKVIISVQNEKNLHNIKKIFPDTPVFIYDVKKDKGTLKEKINQYTDKFTWYASFSCLCSFLFRKSIIS